MIIAEYRQVIEAVQVLPDKEAEIQEIMNERRGDDSTHGYSDFDGNEMLDTEVPDTQENEEVYRLESILEEVNNVGDMGVVHTLVADEGVVCIDQVEAQELMLEVVHEEVGENNHLRQQCKKLLLGLEIFNDKVYNNFFLAEALFLDLQVTKHTKFYWKCLNTLQDTDEDKLQLLEAMTGVSRNNEDIPKQLGLGLSHGMGTPPNAQHWGTPPNAQQWGTPPNPQQWGVQPGFQRAPSTTQQWGTPPTAPQWGTPPNAQQWGTPPNAQQWNTPPNAQQWGTPPNV
ncbi:hypothetical protein HID58_055045, partial [Brassica napus]